MRMPCAFFLPCTDRGSRTEALIWVSAPEAVKGFLQELQPNIGVAASAYIPGLGLNTNWSVLDSPAAAVIFWMDVPSFSCHAVTV